MLQMSAWHLEILHKHHYSENPLSAGRKRQLGKDCFVCESVYAVHVSGGGVGGNFDKLANRATSLLQCNYKHSGMARYYPSCPVVQSYFVYSTKT